MLSIVVLLGSLQLPSSVQALVNDDKGFFDINIKIVLRGDASTSGREHRLHESDEHGHGGK